MSGPERPKLGWAEQIARLAPPPEQQIEQALFADRVSRVRLVAGDPDDTARALIAGRRWAATVPPRFAAAALADLAGEVLDKLAGWIEEPELPNLVLLGPVGSGKSHAACAAVRPLVERGMSLEFWPVVRLLDQLRPGRDPDPYDDVARADLLVLDDLGAEKATEWTAERLYAIVNDRWLARRPTIVTTNLAPPQLAAAVGERLASRLLGGATIARLSGADRRMSP